MKNDKQDLSTKFFGMMYLISTSVAENVNTCYYLGYGIYDYYLVKKLSFGDATSWLTAFLQNMIGNVITFNNYY
jgi:surface polysaccharide O-acyltransferase-like enzyme